MARRFSTRLRKRQSRVRRRNNKTRARGRRRNNKTHARRRYRTRYNRNKQGGLPIPRGGAFFLGGSTQSQQEFEPVDLEELAAQADPASLSETKYLLHELQRKGFDTKKLSTAAQDDESLLREILLQLQEQEHEKQKTLTARARARAQAALMPGPGTTMGPNTNVLPGHPL